MLLLLSSFIIIIIINILNVTYQSNVLKTDKFTKVLGKVDGRFLLGKETLILTNSPLERCNKPAFRLGIYRNVKIQRRLKGGVTVEGGELIGHLTSAG